MAGFPRHHIDQCGNGECRQAHTAQDHQHPFEHIERRPFQMPVGLQNDRCRHWMERQISRIFTACGPSPAAILSCNGFAAAMKPDLSTSVTNFTPSFSSFACDLCSSAMARAGSFVATSFAAASTQTFCSAVSESHSLPL